MRYLIISCILLLSLTVYAAEEPVLEFKGFLETQNKSYFVYGNPDLIDNGRNQVRFLLKSRTDPDMKTKLFSAVEIRYDEMNPARNRTYLKEGYIDYEKEAYDFRVGKQIYSWGKADRINPTNNLNPVDYSDLFDYEDEEIGVVSLLGRYYFGKTTFEGVLIPVFEASVLPANNSRWNLIPKSLIPLPVQVNKPPAKFSNTQMAAKISTSSGGWDYSVSHYYGFEKIPTVFINSNPDLLILDYRKLNVFGADLATSFDKLGVRGEAGYFLTDDFYGKITEVSNPYLQYVLGLDYNFADLIGDQDLNILCQWIQDISLPERNGGLISESDLKRLFKKALMLKLDWSFTDFTKIYFQGIGRLPTKDFFFQPLLSSNLADALNLEIGMDIFYGKKESLLESFKDNQRIFAKLKYSF